MRKYSIMVFALFCLCGKNEKYLNSTIDFYIKLNQGLYKEAYSLVSQSERSNISEDEFYKIYKESISFQRDILIKEDRKHFEVLDTMIRKSGKDISVSLIIKRPDREKITKVVGMDGSISYKGEIPKIIDTIVISSFKNGDYTSGISFGIDKYNKFIQVIDSINNVVIKNIELDIELIKISPFLVTEMDYTVKNNSGKSVSYIDFTLSYKFNKIKGSVSFYSNPIKPGETKRIKGDIANINFDESKLLVLGWRKLKKTGYLKKDDIKKVTIDNISYEDYETTTDFAKKESMVNLDMFDNIVTATALLK